MANDWQPDDTRCPWCGVYSDLPKVVRRPAPGRAEIECRHCKRTHYRREDAPGNIFLFFTADLAEWAQDELRDQGVSEYPVIQKP